MGLDSWNLYTFIYLVRRAILYDFMKNARVFFCLQQAALFTAESKMAAAPN